MKSVFVKLVLLLCSTSAFALGKGDLVVTDFQQPDGPYHIQGCFTQKDEQVCKLVETGEFYNQAYLHKYEEQATGCSFHRDQSVAVTFNTITGPYTVDGLYRSGNECIYKLRETGEFYNEAYIRLFE